MEQIRTYSNIISDVEHLLNTSLRGNGTENKSLLPLLTELKNSFGIVVSREFLNGLMIDKDNDKKSRKIRTLIKKDNLKVRAELRTSVELYHGKKEVFIIDYGHKDFFGNILNTRYQTIGTECIKKSGEFFQIIQIA